MKIFNSRKIKIQLFSLFAMLAIATVVFSWPAESEGIHQDPTVTSKQIEALPRSTSSPDRVALYQALLDLSNPWTVMCIAAHPDDEDGTSLIVMRRKYGAHTVSLFSTFGEGGQNAIGPELYEELGAIRARETLAAAKIQGSEPHFVGLKDFGFSKSADEAFKFWGHEEALRRMVLEIRKLRPDVIITNHSVTNNDHGHHQATARLELEAFDAAADPSRFPEQLKDGLTTWQVQRLFVRARGTQTQNDNAGLVTIDPNGRDINRNVSFAEEALEALQKHATQGPWPKSVAQMAARFNNSSDGRLPLIRYRLAREAKGVAPLIKDSDSFLAGMVVPAETGKLLAPLWSDHSSISINERERVLPQLMELAKEFHQANKSRVTSDMPRIELMEARLNSALTTAAGLEITVTPATETLVPGTPASFVVTISNRGSSPVSLSTIDLIGTGIDKSGPPSTQALTPGNSVRVVREFETPRATLLTVPHRDHLYDGRALGETFTALVPVAINGEKFLATGSVSVDIAPAVEITSVVPSLLVLTPQTGNQSKLTFAVQSHLLTPITGLAGAFGNYPSRKGSELASTTLSLAPRESREVSMTAKMKIGEFSNIELTVDGGKPRSLLSKFTLPVIKADARIAPNLSVGYVRGFDYSLPNALSALGVESKELSVEEVRTADLQKYSTVIVDNRVYESEPGLIAANQKLLDYANAGGTLIVFYHKSFEWNPDQRRNRPQLAPYKLLLGDERITDENAPITFLEPQHSLLNFPNKMGPEDFVGWIQERGLYYPKEWDPQFHALLQSNDPGEAPLKGGLLVADYGRGRYIYTSMVWYRELRAGVPGAYRMLANMISYGKGK
jgi:LmbE family N-acetylglucosaminyl deacetylase